jgi:hypothetical protein
MHIVRDEPDTGGASRTPRAQIEPVFGTGDEVEPDMAIDASSSEGWPDSLAPGVTTWEVQIEAARQFVINAAALDSQAAAEQVGGDDDKGGVYSAFFNQGLVKIGKGDDDGDLNETNFHGKVSAIRVRTQEGDMVPLPYGATSIMPTITYLDGHYLDEFGDRPVAERPKRARAVWTDGAMKDYQEFGRRLAEDHTDKWPQEEWFVAILGQGDDHDETLQLYQRIAKDHPHLHIYSFDQVSNPKEIAEDMTIAMLGHQLS